MKDVVRHWLAEIDAAKKREKDYRDEGKRILKIYAGNKADAIPFNILYSNTETLLPACYSQVPRPVVQRRFKDEDPIGKAAAQASTRLLEFLLDTNIDGYESFDDSMRRCVLDALLPGRGVTQLKYDADVVGGDMPYKASELVCTDSKDWNKVLIGYANKWSDVPWVAFELILDKKEAKEKFGDVANKLKYTTGNQDADGEEDEKTNEEKHEGEKKTVLVYQIWDKEGGKKIRYLCPEYKDDLLKVEDDPLQLTGFYNFPRPLQFVEKNNLLPTALYALYENQAKELNEVSRRINLLVRAIKAKAIYAGGLGDDIKRLVDANDNELVAADNESTLAAEKGLQNAIWFWPVDQLIVVLRELMGAREQCKQVIYEITGISDILRGSTVASETATAQKIKSQWGSLRLKRLQKEVQRYARDLLRIMLELAATKFSEETWAKMTGLPFSTAAQIEQAKLLMAIAQKTGQQPEPQTLQVLQSPAWAQVLKVLRDDLQRAYRIDIETNSTVEVEATEDKEMMGEAMAAVGQALNGLTPLVTAGTLPFEAAQAMLLTIMRRFRFGPEIEDMIKSMKQPVPPDQAKQQMEQEKAAMQQQQQQIQQQAQQAIQQAKQSAVQSKQAADQATAEKDALKTQTDLALREQKLKFDEEVFRLEKQFAEKTLQQQAQTENVKLTHQQKMATLDNGKYKTENVVAKKSEDTLGKGLQGLTQIVNQQAQAISTLMQTVTEQAHENREQVQGLTKAITAKRIKKPIRGKNGAIESVIEEMAEE